jgi:hypothetical protein
VRWVGRPLPRYKDPVLLQGRARYTADLVLQPGFNVSLV